LAVKGLLVVLAVVALSIAGCGPKDSPEQVVVINGATPGPLALWLGDNSLERGRINFRVNDMVVRGRVYPLRWADAEKHFRKRSLEGRLAVRDEELFLDGRRVHLPNGVKARDVWQAIEWNGWVICLGRTSETDPQTNMVPPFFASELIAFETHKLEATVQWLAPSAPSGPSLLVLDPIRGSVSKNPEQ